MVMAFFVRGFINAKSCDLGLIVLLYRALNPVIKNRPQTFGINIQNLSGFVDGHFIFNQTHVKRFEEQSKTAAFARPCDRNLPHHAGACRNARHIGVQKTRMLEKNQMLPGAFQGMINRTFHSRLVFKFSALGKGEIEVELFLTRRVLRKYQALDTPRRREAKASSNKQSLFVPTN